MPMKSGRVDENSIFTDNQGKSWRLTQEHPAAPSYREMNLDEYQGSSVAVDYEVEEDPWLVGVGDVIRAE